MINSISSNTISDRAEVLDALRGMAILGIFFDNILAFSGYVFMSQENQMNFSTYPIDSFLTFLEMFLVNGKFYTQFSLLFGIGFSIILEKNQRNGIAPLPVFYRRLGILFLMGWIHLRLVWEGDILLLYAFLGFFLPLFRNVSNKTLISVAGMLILSSILIDGIKILTVFQPGNFFYEQAVLADKKNGIPLNESFAEYLYTSGAGWAEWRNWMDSGWLYRIQYLLESNRLPKVFGCFLIGLWVGRIQLFKTLKSNQALLQKVQFWGFGLGIPFCLATAYLSFHGDKIPQPEGILETVSYALGVVPLGLAFAATFAVLWTSSKGKAILIHFAPVGRMALSNYLFQSVMGIGIFYGVGLGLGLKFGPSIFFPMVILLFFLQMVLSKIWLRYFNYGPMEWIWRVGTYLKWIPLKKQSPAKAP